jgi:hypothetical protein
MAIRDKEVFFTSSRFSFSTSTKQYANHQQTITLTQSNL